MSILSKRIFQQFKNWQKSTNKRGFTLIELLVAISIIAVLSTIGIVAYSTAQRNARDSKRKQDLRALSTSLELYYQENKRYPCTADGTTGWKTSNTTPSFWITDTGCTSNEPFDSDYVRGSALPIDPLKNSGITNGLDFGYAYWARSDGGCKPKGQEYILLARLENPKDKETLAYKSAKYCDGRDLLIDYSYSGQTFVITSY